MKKKQLKIKKLSRSELSKVKGGVIKESIEETNKDKRYFLDNLDDK